MHMVDSLTHARFYSRDLSTGLFTSHSLPDIENSAARNLMAHLLVIPSVGLAADLTTLSGVPCIRPP